MASFLINFVSKAWFWAGVGSAMVIFRSRPQWSHKARLGRTSNSQISKLPEVDPCTHHGSFGVSARFCDTKKGFPKTNPPPLFFRGEILSKVSELEKHRSDPPQTLGFGFFGVFGSKPLAVRTPLPRSSEPDPIDLNACQEAQVTCGGEIELEHTQPKQAGKTLFPRLSTCARFKVGPTGIVPY